MRTADSVDRAPEVSNQRLGQPCPQSFQALENANATRVSGRNGLANANRPVNLGVSRRDGCDAFEFAQSLRHGMKGHELRSHGLCAGDGTRPS